jgi:glutathione S-transferase
LKDKDFLATKEVTVADVVLAVHLRYFFCLLLDEKLRAPLQNLTKWFVRMMETPTFLEYFGKTWLCQK